MIYILTYCYNGMITKFMSSLGATFIVCCHNCCTACGGNSLVKWMLPPPRFLVSDLLTAPITHLTDKWGGTAGRSMVVKL